MNIKPGIYRNSKSQKEYQVLGVAHHSETLEKLVVYRANYDSDGFGTNALWVRPLEIWNELVEIDGIQVPRFVKI